MLSVGWIIWNPETQKKKRTVGQRNSANVYRSERIAKRFCEDGEVPKEVFIQDDE